MSIDVQRDHRRAVAELRLHGQSFLADKVAQTGHATALMEAADD